MNSDPSSRAEKRSSSSHDIYALGVVFYQMLTGEMPDQDLQPPSKKVSIDVRLDDVVLRALEQKPALRYQQASLLKTEVETIASTSPMNKNAAPRPHRARQKPSALRMPNKIRWAIPALGLAVIIAIPLQNRLMHRKGPIADGASTKSTLEATEDPLVFEKRLAAKAQVIESAPFIASLSTGSVELVAVARFPSENEPWWRPDGTPAGTNLFKTTASGASSEDFQMYTIVARLTDLPDDASEPRWKLEPRNSWAEGRAISVRDADSGPFVLITAKQPRSASTMNVSIGIATGPWETVASAKAHKIPPLPQPSAYGEVVLSQPSAVDQGLRLKATHTFRERDMDMRLIAVEDDGTKHFGVDIEQASTERIGYTSATFPGLLADQRNLTLQFQVRPYEWVAFKNVSLESDE